MLQLMSRLSYSITTHFIPSNKDYNSYCNLHVMYQTCPKEFFLLITKLYQRSLSIQKLKPMKITNYISSSLCNVIYKLLSKVLASRLNASQINFRKLDSLILGHLITNNISMTFETINYMHNKRVGKRNDTTLKLYISKAFDKVKCFLLEKILMTTTHSWYDSHSKKSKYLSGVRDKGQDLRF